MAKISQQVRINVPKNKVWEILADFGSVSKWGPIVNQSALISSSKQGVGTERSCDIQQVGSVTEKAIEWDEGNGYTFELKGVESIKSMITKFSLSAEGDQTIITADTEFESAGGEAEQKGLEHMVQGSLKLIVQGLKQYAETGQKMSPPPMP
ncbi:MAG: SRPBCC family protein [Thaumarchaeota archaeon]|nr:SRPBCC family protein [Nitrososphaerota archaeon]